jgi:hypothetical protein
LPNSYYIKKDDWLLYIIKINECQIRKK